MLLKKAMSKRGSSTPAVPEYDRAAAEPVTEAAAPDPQTLYAISSCAVKTTCVVWLQDRKPTSYSAGNTWL